MTAKFLSIVTISFNQAKFLRETLESVIQQKTPDIEYIVVDPGSTDGSREIINEYRPFIDQVIFEPDQGPADGLNKGFIAATGQYGYFLNSDDFLLPGSLRLLRAACIGHQVDVLLGGAWVVNAESSPLREVHSQLDSPSDISSLLNRRTRFVQQGMVFRMDTFRKAGGFNPHNRSCWDYELLCDMVSAGAKLATLEERIGCFRIHENSITGGATGDAGRERYRADLERIYRRFRGGLPSSRGGFMDRVSLFARSPSVITRRFREMVCPWTITRRWESDLRRS